MTKRVRSGPPRQKCAACFQTFMQRAMKVQAAGWWLCRNVERCLRRAAQENRPWRKETP